jgi:predicted secreted protein
MKEAFCEVYKTSLKTGQFYSLKLGGLGSAGYLWEYNVGANEGIVKLDIERSSPPPKSPGQNLPSNYSVEETLIITALNQGFAKVEARLRRPWEKDKQPLRTVLVEVTVSL